MSCVEEKRTAFGRTPTDKAWQELKRHRQQMQNDSTRIMDEIGHLEREVGALQARLEEDRLDRAAQLSAAVATLDAATSDTASSGPASSDTVSSDIAPSDTASSDDSPESSSQSDEIDITGGSRNLKLDSPLGESKAFDSFFAADDSELDKERRFLLD